MSKNKKIYSELQLEYIEKRRKVRKLILSFVFFGLFGIVIVFFLVGLSVVLGDYVFPELIGALGNAGYTLILLGIVFLIVLAIIVVKNICGLIKLIIFEHNVNKFDFKIRGFLTREEYKLFNSKSVSFNEIKNFNNYIQGVSFDERYVALQNIVNILTKFKREGITEDMLLAVKKKEFAYLLREYIKVCDLFDEVKELNKAGKQSTFFINWKPVGVLEDIL